MITAIITTACVSLLIGAALGYYTACEDHELQRNINRALDEK